MSAPVVHCCVIPDEWWHFDYKDWKLYPIINVKFEDLGQ
jgi:D-alanyl-D-alanine dipeptidase